MTTHILIYLAGFITPFILAFAFYWTLKLLGEWLDNRTTYPLEDV